MSEPVLEVRGVTKRFGAITALSSASLTIGENELLVVTGPTGAGKTTLLRVIAGLEQPDEGEIRLAGADATRLPPAARDVALVFQNFSLYPRFSVRRNLEFPLRAPGRRLPEPEIRARVESAARLLRIEGHLDRPAHRLSGGEMQRVAIGRALVRRPRLFLLDEPLTNLDAKLREALRTELVELRRSLRTPMIYVTHDPTEALSMADRLVVISGGTVLQTGEPEEVWARPVSPVVARQLGEPPINILDATASDGFWRTAEGVALCPAPAHAPSAACIGVRPEHIAVSGGNVAAEILVVEDLGHTRILLVELGGVRFRIAAPADPALRKGVTIRPRPDPDRIVIWPARAAAT